MKEFAWHGCTVRITKKKVRNTNLRIRPEEPQTIHVSIPFSMTYEEARQLLEEPKVVRWAERYRKKLRDAPKRPIKRGACRTGGTISGAAAGDATGAFPEMGRDSGRTVWESDHPGYPFPVGKLQHPDEKYFHQCMAWCFFKGLC